MIQRGSGACFGEQTRSAASSGPRRRAQHLQRDDPAELEIFGAIDIAHAARAEVLEDLVVRERLADHPAIITGKSVENYRADRGAYGGVRIRAPFDKRSSYD